MIVAPPAAVWVPLHLLRSRRADQIARRHAGEHRRALVGDAVNPTLRVAVPVWCFDEGVTTHGIGVAVAGLLDATRRFGRIAEDRIVSLDVGEHAVLVGRHGLPFDDLVKFEQLGQHLGRDDVDVAEAVGDVGVVLQRGIGNGTENHDVRINAAGVANGLATFFDDVGRLAVRMGLLVNARQRNLVRICIVGCARC